DDVGVGQSRGVDACVRVRRDGDDLARGPAQRVGDRQQGGTADRLRKRTGCAFADQSHRGILVLLPRTQRPEGAAGGGERGRAGGQHAVVRGGGGDDPLRRERGIPLDLAGQRVVDERPCRRGE